MYDDDNDDDGDAITLPAGKTKPAKTAKQAKIAKIAKKAAVSSSPVLQNIVMTVSIDNRH